MSAESLKKVSLNINRLFMFSTSFSFQWLCFFFLWYYFFQIFGDEVQPFFLDEEFDYDNVTLTPKFTAGEIATIQELAKKRMMDTNTDFCEHHDWVNRCLCVQFYFVYTQPTLE